MPFIARWPGNIPANTKLAGVHCHTDMIATFAAITGQRLPNHAGEDSYNILPALLGKQNTGHIREATIHQLSRRYLAIRQGNWKLIPGLGSCGFTKPSTLKAKPGQPTCQLHNLKKDPGETRNVYAEHPNIVVRLTALLEKYKSEDCSMPRIQGQGLSRIPIK